MPFYRFTVGLANFVFSSAFRLGLRLGHRPTTSGAWSIGQLVKVLAGIEIKQPVQKVA